MRFLSVCSGIEAASVAWPSWECAAVAEIEKFPYQAGDVLTGDVIHSLGTNSNATGRNAINVAIGLDSELNAVEDGAGPLKAISPSGGVPGMVGCFKGGQGSKAGGIGFSEHSAPTLSSAPSGTQLSPTLLRGMQVRRLTPTECERLQGFPDNWTEYGDYD